MGGLTRECLILQTDHVLPARGNRAKFVVRRANWTNQGMTSIRAGYGTWHYSRDCLHELLLHGGFRVLEERRPRGWGRHRLPWYAARCEPLRG